MNNPSWLLGSGPLLTGSRFSMGDFLNVVAAGLVLLTAYYYAQYRRATKDEEKAEARRKTTAIGVLFLFYTYVIVTFLPGVDTWTAQIGLSMQNYFRNLADKLAIIGTRKPRSPDEHLFASLRTLGLVAYIFLFSGMSIIAKFPVKVYNSLFVSSSSGSSTSSN